MAKADLTAQRLRELLHYDPETGAFTWLVDRQGHAKAGDVAGCRRSDGYIRMKVDQHGVWAHRLAWFWVHGDWPEQVIDHINGDPSDNRIANLRDVPAATNSQNVKEGRKRKGRGTLLGAHWSVTWNRWKSSINVGGKLRHIGWFGTEVEAHNAYVEAKRRLHPGCTI